jgi:hypothetical protein
MDTPPSKSKTLLLSALGLALGIGAGVVVLQTQKKEAATPPAAPAAPAAPATAPVVSAADQALAESRLPLLEKSDPLARQLAAEVTSSEEFAGFFAAPDLIRRLVALVGMVADGERAPSLFAGLSVKGEFQVREQGGKQFIAEASYARYDALTKAVAGLDAGNLEKGYVTLRPALGLAWRAIGRPGRTFEQALAMGLAHLAATPSPTGDVEVVSKGAVYAFADPALEGASAAQKQLMRFGPKNAEVVKNKLGDIAKALALPTVKAAP